MMAESLAVLGLPGWLEITVICFFALILFGRRLPFAARSIGQSVVEFKRGLRTVDERDAPSSAPE